MKLITAVQIVVNDFVKQARNFSVHDVTKEIRAQSGSNFLGLEVDNTLGDGRPFVSHDQVKECFEELYQNGLISVEVVSDNGVYRTFGAKQPPVVPPVTTNDGIVVIGKPIVMTGVAPNAYYPPLPPTQLPPNCSCTQQCVPITKQDIIDYVYNSTAKGYEATIRYLTKRFRRNGNITNQQMIDICEGFGFRINDKHKSKSHWIVVC
jgi:hypothetical protein